MGGGGGKEGGAYAASQTTVLHMKRLNQTKSPIFSDFRDLVCSLFPKAILFYFYSYLLFFVVDIHF